ncbi:hypothetical protein B0H13DRAFT_1646920, partial [Mycena leptocephala]
SGEALRCIANAPLLIERSRAVLLSEEVNGGETCVALLQKSTSFNQIFILARFLVTVHVSPFITALAEEEDIVYVISIKLDLLPQPALGHDASTRRNGAGASSARGCPRGPRGRPRRHCGGSTGQSQSRVRVRARLVRDAKVRDEHETRGERTVERVCRAIGPGLGFNDVAHARVVQVDSLGK